MVIPKPCCACRVCEEARRKGVPYERTGPSAFVHDENILVDTPAEIAVQLNRCGIEKVEHLMFSHMDPDHMEGIRVVEQIALDFRTWEAYPEKRIRLVIPEYLYHRLRKVRSAYGPLIDYYERQGFVETETFRDRVRIGRTDVAALDVDRGSQIAFVYVFERTARSSSTRPAISSRFPKTDRRFETRTFWSSSRAFSKPGSSTGSSIRRTTFPGRLCTRSNKPWRCRGG